MIMLLHYFIYPTRSLGRSVLSSVLGVGELLTDSGRNETRGFGVLARVTIALAIVAIGSLQLLAQETFRRATVPSDSSDPTEITNEDRQKLPELQEDNLEAIVLKAKALVKLKKYESAYQLYEELVAVNPNYFRELVNLNKRLDREERNGPLCEKALAKFKDLADKKEYQTEYRRWVVIESGIAMTLWNLGRYEEAETRLKEIIESYGADPKLSPRREYLQRQLAETYINWAGSVADPKVSIDSLPATAMAQQLELFIKAFDLAPENPAAQQSISRFALSKNAEISEKAKSVYDPTAAVTPITVLTQLGNQAIVNKNFSEAIRYYELAHKNSPRDPAIMNNLAYVYLVTTHDGHDPERALQLASETIQNLPKNLSPLDTSMYLHTKATALKQLNRLTEAIEFYELVLKPRPDHRDSLQSLIGCYRVLKRKPPEKHVTRLKQLGE